VRASIIQQASVLNGRQLVMVVVVGLHALVIGGLMTMRIVIDQPQPPHVFKAVTADLVPPDPQQARPELEPDDVRPKWVLPSMPSPDIASEEYKWVAPDLGTIINSAEGAPGIGADADGGDIAGVPATELSYRATRSPDDYYPAVSLQLQEQGTSIVRVCVAPSGRLDGVPVIERSSGSRRLDTAAIQWAREALAFTPATRNGAAVAACKGFRVRFNLR